MSKRLSYLLKARPEAAEAYFKFLKESGKHLDDKTRFLISVVTKVISNTPEGLKQYVPHAIRAGASGQEVVDAILMSFPAAGLTKMLDSLNVLQEMDLPELRIKNLNKKPDWLDIGAISDFPDMKPVVKEISENKILIFKIDDKINVFDGRCPHLGNKLPAKANGSILTCSTHKWKFDLITGKCLENGDRNLHPIASRVVDGTVQVKIILFE